MTTIFKRDFRKYLLNTNEDNNESSAAFSRMGEKNNSTIYLNSETQIRYKV